MNSKKIENKKLIQRKSLLIFGDIAASFISIFLAVVLRFNTFDVVQYHNDALVMSLVLAVFVVISYKLSSLYKSLWKFASVEEMVKLIIASLVSIALLFLLNLALGHKLPSSVYPIAFFIQAGLSGAIRFSYRIARVLKSIYGKNTLKNSEDRIIVIGGGYEAVATIKSYTEGQKKGNIVALIDRYHVKGTKIHNITIEGDLTQLENIITQYSANIVVIASNYFTEDDISVTLGICSKTKCKLKKYNSVGEVGGKNQITEINPTDLLGRPQVDLNIKVRVHKRI